MRSFLPVSLLGFFTFFLFVLIFQVTKPVHAAPATHVVISEIQIADSSSSNSADFVELYNPTNSPINLGDMRLAKRTSTGTTDTNIIAFTQDHVIPAHGYFLWCNTVLNEEYQCDASTSGTISGDNSIILRQDPADTGNIIDAVTIGSPTNPIGEGTALDNPDDGGSVERKANASSTLASMTTGADALMGNGEDTNNNAADFILRTTSQPQNSSSAVEPQGVTPSLTPTVPVSPSVTPSVTITATPTPSATPTATNTPTPIPATPTAIPTSIPTPTTKPSTPVITWQLVCTEKVKTYRVLGMEFHITYPTCKVVRS